MATGLLCSQAPSGIFRSTRQVACKCLLGVGGDIGKNSWDQAQMNLGATPRLWVGWHGYGDSGRPHWPSLRMAAWGLLNRKHEETHLTLLCGSWDPERKLGTQWSLHSTIALYHSLAPFLGILISRESTSLVFLSNSIYKNRLSLQNHNLPKVQGNFKDVLPCTLMYWNAHWKFFIVCQTFKFNGTWYIFT